MVHIALSSAIEPNKSSSPDSLLMMIDGSPRSEEGITHVHVQYQYFLRNGLGGLTRQTSTNNAAYYTHTLVGLVLPPYAASPCRILERTTHTRRCRQDMALEDETHQPINLVSCSKK
jgi:hypothetical protein